MMNASPSALGVAEDIVSVVSTGTDTPQFPVISASEESVKSPEEAEPRPLHRFSEYSLRPELQATLARKGFEHPMPVQVSVLEDPSLTEGDLIVQARTGSGKTLAFALPLLNEMSPSSRAPYVLVLSPTRELALQTAREFSWAASGLDLRVASLVGGMDMERQFRSLSDGAAIVVGTPGRVMDHIRRGSFRGNSVEVLVLDEGDHMLDLGFRAELEGIMQALPNRKRTWLYSATMPEEVVTLARRYLDAPRKVSLVSDITCHEDIVQAAYLIPGRRRFDGLVNVLLLERPERALIFCATRAETQDIADRLSDEGFRAGSIHGDMTQRERNSALAGLKGGRIEILVATDVAARGLDIQGVSHVIQFGLPGCIESFVHRSGRTGRAGRSGKNLVLVTAREARIFKGMISSTHLRLEWLPAPDRSELEGLTRTRLVEDLTEATSESEDHLTWADELLDRPDARSLVAAMLGRLSSVRGGGYSIKADLEQELAREQNRRDYPRRDGRGNGVRGGRGEPSSHRFDPAEGVLVRFQGGRQNGVEVGRMLGSLCRALGIRGDDVGNIRLRDDHAQVELSSRGAAALRDRREQLDREGLVMDGEPRPITGGGRSGGYRGGEPRGSARRFDHRREDSAPRGGSGTRFRGEGSDDGYGRRPRR